LDDEEEEVSNY